MKLTRENIYINLQGKSEDELNYLEYLTGLKISRQYNYLHFNQDVQEWWDFCEWSNGKVTKQEVTIQQLKEILQPMENTETLQQQLEKAEAEVKRLKEAIEDNKIKVGDVCKFWDNNENSFVIGVVQYVYENARLKYETIFDCQFPNAEKITDQELINKLNELIK